MKTGRLTKQLAPAYEPTVTPTNSGVLSPELYKSIIHTSSSGIVKGGAIHLESPTTFGVSEGYGYLINNDADEPEIQRVEWSKYTGLTTPYIDDFSITYVSIDENGNVDLQNEHDRPIGSHYRHKLYLGRIGHSNGTLVAQSSEMQVCYDPASGIRDIFDWISTVNLDGNFLSPVPGKLEIAKTQGMTLRAGANFINDKNNPNIVINPEINPCPLVYRYFNGQSYKSLSSGAEVNPNEYFSLDSTSMLEVSPGHWTISQIGYSTASNTLLLTVPEQQYPSLIDAQLRMNQWFKNAGDPIFEGLSLLGVLLIKQGCTSLDQHDACLLYNFKRGKLYLENPGFVSTMGSLSIQDNSVSNMSVWSSEKIENFVTDQIGTTSSLKERLVQKLN